MRFVVRKDVYDEIKKGIIFHTRTSSRGKVYEVPYHTKDDYTLIHKLNIYDSFDKSTRRKIDKSIEEYKSKYYSLYKKKTDKLAIQDLQIYISHNHHKSPGQRKYNIDSILYKNNKNIEELKNKYSEFLGKQEAQYQAFHDSLYEKVPGINENEKLELKTVLEKTSTKWEDVSLTEKECKTILMKEYNTPIGNVHFGENQLNKFNVRERMNLIWAADKIMTNPSIIVETREKPIFFVKTFNKEDDKKITIVSIMIQGKNALISTHPEKINTILTKTKKNGILYKKDS